MTIEQLSSVRFVINLSSDDMKTFSLDFENICFENPYFQKVLKRLLKLAQERITISMLNKALYIEALERLGGCVLVITALPRGESAQKRYRLKRSGGAVMYSFECSDDLTDCMAQLYKNDCRLLKGEVFSTDGGYRLIISSGFSIFSRRAKGVLSEYSEKITENEIKIAQVREHGSVLADGFPVMKIGEAFAEK